MFRSLLRRSVNRNARFYSSGEKVVQPKGIKQLMQVYGYSALAVYVTISLIDFPLSYVMVHSLGEMRIKLYLNRLKQAAGYGKDEQELMAELEEKTKSRAESARDEHVSVWGKFKQSNLLTELLIAYGIHKSLIFVRVPLTAAITPATTRILHRYGIRLGNMKMMSQEAKTRYKTNNNSKPADFAVPRQKQTTLRKWFDGLM